MEDVPEDTESIRRLVGREVRRDPEESGDANELLELLRGHTESASGLTQAGELGGADRDLFGQGAELVGECLELGFGGGDGLADAGEG